MALYSVESRVLTLHAWEMWARDAKMWGDMGRCAWRWSEGAPAALLWSSSSRPGLASPNPNPNPNPSLQRRGRRPALHGRAAPVAADQADGHTPA